MSENAAQVAASLSKAQRSFVLMPLYSAFSLGVARAWFHDTNYSVARVIAKLGLATRLPIEPGYMASVPTSLGFAVRAILQRDAADA